MRMKTMLIALAALTAIACSAPTEDGAAEATSSNDSELGAAAPEGLRIEATWARVVTGTPTIGDDATTPIVHVSLRVNDREIRAAHPGFDGLERPWVNVPRADGTTTRLELSFRYTTQEGFMELHPIDVYDNDTFFVTEADLTVIRAQGVSLGLDTNVGAITTDVTVEPRVR